MKRIVIGTVSALALLACASVASAQNVAKGKQVFTDQKCSMCHSVAGQGNAAGKLDGIGSKLTADQIRQWITDPATMAAKAKADRKPPMSTMAPRFKSIPKGDLDALVAYVSSLKN